MRLGQRRPGGPLGRPLRDLGGRFLTQVPLFDGVAAGTFEKLAPLMDCLEVNRRAASRRLYLTAPRRISSIRRAALHLSTTSTSSSRVGTDLISEGTVPEHMCFLAQ